MKTIKPMKLGVMHRVFEDGDRFLLAVAALVYFPFERPQRLLPEVKLWKTMATELGADSILDECMPKPKAELLVDGHAFPPGDAAQPICKVRVVLGSIDKSLYAIGDREWIRGSATDPLPFTKLAVNWANAFGGEGYADNPLGRGYKSVKDEQTGEERHLLPNIEHPGKLVVSPRDRPPPQGFGYIDLTWPARQRYVGTYDNDWLRTRFPGFPVDFDWRFFQVAPEDQQLDAPFEGGEPFRIEHMHPDKPIIESNLPKLTVRCFVTMVGEGGENSFKEVPMRAETVRLIPHIERGVFIYRGVIEVTEDDAADVLQLILGADDTDEPRPASYYAKMLELRLDKEKAHIYALRDRDLLPPSAYAGEPVVDEAISDMEELLKSERLLEQNSRRKAESELEALRADLIRRGLDPVEKGVPTALPPMEVYPGVDDLPEYVEEQLALAEATRKDAEEQRDAQLEEIRQKLAKHGVDLDEAIAKHATKSGGPPSFRAEAELERMRGQVQLGKNAGIRLEHIEAQLADPELFTKLKHVEQMSLQMYRQFAQHYPAAGLPDDDHAKQLGLTLRVRLQAGQSLSDCDFTGANLAGLDLSGANLAGVFLEGASLVDCNLQGADLSGAVLVRADLTGTTLVGATLDRANLAASTLHDVRAAAGSAGAGAVSCEETIFVGASFQRADFRGARLVRADLGEARFAESSFAGASAEQLLFLNSDISGVSFRGATFNKCNFLEVACEGTDFAESSMESSVFLKARGAGASFRGAKLNNFRVVFESSFPDADFSNTVMPESNLRGSNLERGNFTGAEIGSSDFSECNLQDAVFSSAQAVQSLWIRSDLRRANLTQMNAMMAIMQKANIEGADFRGANLFRVDFARIKGNVATNFEGANMKQVRFVDRGDHGKR